MTGHPVIIAIIYNICNGRHVHHHHHPHNHPNQDHHNHQVVLFVTITVTLAAISTITFRSWHRGLGKGLCHHHHPPLNHHHHHHHHPPHQHHHHHHHHHQVVTPQAGGVAHLKEDKPTGHEVRWADFQKSVILGHFTKWKLQVSRNVRKVDAT